MCLVCRDGEIKNAGCGCVRRTAALPDTKTDDVAELRELAAWWNEKTKSKPMHPLVSEVRVLIMKEIKIKSLQAELAKFE